jgi:hypothetical protein
MKHHPNQETEIRIIISFYGDNYDPAIVTEKLKINPTKTWNKGDKKGATSLVHKDYGWYFALEKFYLNELSICLFQMIELLEPKKNLITELIDQYKLDAVISCYVVPNRKHNPDLFLDNNLINRIAALNCSLDIDINV